MNHYDAHKESIKGKTLTAYELADAMDKKGFRYREVKAAVKMLRQQQAEIEHLKELFGCDPAYFEPYKKVKTLTDEEIEELAMEYLENTGKGIVGVYDFVRAILKKANNG